MLRDGHIHTPFCPHGTNDSLEAYVEKAISLGFTEITFTEHAPLPAGFIDTTPSQDSSMKLEMMEDYLLAIEQVKKTYKNNITIYTGLEIDYIDGYEKEIKEFLQTYGTRLDDTILSVHFLKYGHTYDCLDYSPDVFAKMISKYGSIEKLYAVYFETVLKSINADLGPFKPKRIGHITLIKKFQRRFPIRKDFRAAIIQILSAIKENHYELDYNGAGIHKPLCGEPYPPQWVIVEAKKLDIPLVYGSDAHQIKDLMQGYSQLFFE